LRPRHHRRAHRPGQRQDPRQRSRSRVETFGIGAATAPGLGWRRYGGVMLLKGLKVVDFTAYIAGPGTACILGDWGADVVKVERPGGDNMRHVFADLKNDLGANPTFEVDNRGKRG